MKLIQQQLTGRNPGSGKIARWIVVLGVSLAVFPHSHPVWAENDTVFPLAPGASTNIGGPLVIGTTGTNNSLTIISGGAVTNTSGMVGQNSTANDNWVLVSGSGSLWTNNGQFYLGRDGSRNELVITNGGLVSVGAGAWGFEIGTAATAKSNTVIVTGSGSVLSVAGSGSPYHYVGRVGSDNQLIITNGGVVEFTVGANLLVGGGGLRNKVLVTDGGSTLNLASNVFVGVYAGGGLNQLIIANGGRVNNAGATVGNGAAGGWGSNSVLVTGSGSVWSNSGTLYIGYGGASNLITVADGGRLISRDGYLGFGYAYASSNAVVVTGSGSVWTNSGGLTVGEYGAYNQLLISGGAEVYSSTGTVGKYSSGSNNLVLITGAGSAWKNSGSLTIGAASSGNQFTIADGGQMTFTNLVVGSGNTLVVSGNLALMPGVVSNAGVVRVTNSVVTYQKPFRNEGGYLSDSSTNLFLDNVTIGRAGYFAGGGDWFEMRKNLLIQSTNQTSFHLGNSTVSFSGGGLHTNTITGRDVGTNGIYGGNFEYGTLRLATTNDPLCLGCGAVPAAPSNALYVSWLDLTALTNDVPNISNLVASVLHAPANINVYYLVLDPRNDYLGGLSYPLTDCAGNAGGGFLRPAIPEPSPLTLTIGVIGGWILWRKRSERKVE